MFPNFEIMASPPVPSFAPGGERSWHRRFCDRDHHLRTDVNGRLKLHGTDHFHADCNRFPSGKSKYF